MPTTLSSLSSFCHVNLERVCRGSLGWIKSVRDSNWVISSFLVQSPTVASTMFNPWKKKKKFPPGIHLSARPVCLCTCVHLSVFVHVSMHVRCGGINPLPMPQCPAYLQGFSSHLVALKRNTHRLICLECQRHQQWPHRQSLSIDQSEWQWRTDEKEKVIGEAMKQGHKRHSLCFLTDGKVTALDVTL